VECGLTFDHSTIAGPDSLNVMLKASPIQYVDKVGFLLRPKKNSCVSGNPTQPIGTGQPYTFFTKMPFVFIGVFKTGVSILNKKKYKKNTGADPT